MRLIDRVRRALDEAGLPAAGVADPGYLLDETGAGRVRLRWGRDDGEVLHESSDRVMACADHLIAEGFDVQPGPWVAGDDSVVIIRR